MNTVEAVADVVEFARRRVLTHRILSGPALMEYFVVRVSLDDGLSIETLQREAGERGLYRYMGERYLLALDFTMACAGAAISCNVIRSNDDLDIFLQRASQALAPFGHCGKVQADLRIDARQKGLYSILEDNSPFSVSPIDAKEPVRCSTRC